jgi:hypothetical protein
MSNVVPFDKKKTKLSSCTNDQSCLDNGCRECCEHDFDPSEGFTCNNCGEQGEASDVYDEDYGKDR